MDHEKKFLKEFKQKEDDLYFDYLAKKGSVTRMEMENRADREDNFSFCDTGGSFNANTYNSTRFLPRLAAEAVEQHYYENNGEMECTPENYVKHVLKDRQVKDIIVCDDILRANCLIIFK